MSSPKRIAFLSNKLTLRGTEIAMYDYADYNETLLNNKSIIITRDYNLIKNQFDVSKLILYVSKLILYMKTNSICENQNKTKFRQLYIV